ncbi:MAG TPA: hypothetical protein VN345_18730 [Blastocatellia bacterium]|jgi:hypothetical protein|nr:hypothetical protein [Blastocatellia bacterium]
MSDPDPKIEALKLNDTARQAAYNLKAKHPGIIFTSGRRDKADQARAMASNVIKNHKWIVQTYKPTPVSTACQDWVDQNPDATSATEIAAGLESVLNGFTNQELRQLSLHLSGDAFDVQPVSQNAAQIEADIRALPGLDKFLDKEGGLLRWHAQFK